MVKVYKQKITLNTNQIKNLIKDKENGMSIKDITEKYNITKKTIYNIIERNKKGGNIKKDKEFKIFKIDDLTDNNSNEIKKSNSEEDLFNSLRLAYLSTRK